MPRESMRAGSWSRCVGNAVEQPVELRLEPERFSKTYDGRFGMSRHCGTAPLTGLKKIVRPGSFVRRS
jgi:hypothetical protein